MSDPGDRPVVDDRVPKGGRVVRPCEFERAYAELIKPRLKAARAPIGICSDSGTEERLFPVSPAGKPYFLCNGHLRDLFEALDHVRAEETAK